MEHKIIITDKDKKIEALSFRKPINFVPGMELPKSKIVDVTFYYDGDLVLLFYSNSRNEWVISKTGTSTKEKINDIYSLLDKKQNQLDKNLSYSFQYAYVYDKFRLLYLASVDVNGNEHTDFDKMNQLGFDTHVEMTYEDSNYLSHFFNNDFEDKIHTLHFDFEQGVVVKHEDGTRVKILFQNSSISPS